MITIELIFWCPHVQQVFKVDNATDVVGDSPDVATIDHDDGLGPAFGSRDGQIGDRLGPADNNNILSLN